MQNLIKDSKTILNTISGYLSNISTYTSSASTYLSTIAGYLLGIQDKIPTGYVEIAAYRFSVASVGSTMVSTQITGLPSFSKLVIKDVEAYFNGTPMDDAYMDLNTAATDVAATKIAGRWFQTGSFIHIDGNKNGIINAELTAAPYIQLCAGASAVGTQTVYITLKLYYLPA